MTPDEPTVFIVDDDAVLRKLVTRLLQTVGLRAEAYASAEEFLAACAPWRPGCLLLDVRMRGMSGIELQRMLRARHVHLPIIFLSGHGDVPMAVHCLQAGAVDFIQKPFRDQDLLDAVRRALEQDARRREVETARRNIQARLAGLTNREREVLRLVIAGKANKQIAPELGISIKAVEAHRARIMRKMGVRSTVELVRVVLTAGEAPGASWPAAPQPTGR